MDVQPLRDSVNLRPLYGGHRTHHQNKREPASQTLTYKYSLIHLQQYDLVILLFYIFKIYTTDISKTIYSCNFLRMLNKMV